MIIKNSGTINYDFFKIYSEAFLIWLRNTLNPLYRIPNEPKGIQQVTVIYGNPERMWADRNLTLSNERINVPIIGVKLESFSPQPSYNIPRSLEFYQKYFLPNNKIDFFKTFKFRKLKTFELVYSADLRTEFKRDVDYILYTLSSQFNNAEIIYLKIVSKKFFPFKYIGEQYIPIKLEGITDNSSYEPGDNADIIIKYRIDFKVLNAYLPVDFTEKIFDKVSIVNNINIELQTLNPDNITYVDEVIRI